MIRTTIGGAAFLLLCAGATRVDAQGGFSSAPKQAADAGDHEQESEWRNALSSNA